MYNQSITHLNRGAVIIVVDCSMSMQEQTYLNNICMSKISAVSVVCNFLIDELLERATRLGQVRNYYDIAVIGYHGDNVESMLEVKTPNNFVSIERLAETKPEHQSLSFEQHTADGQLADARFTLHEWVKPTAGGKTPMFQALATVYNMVDKWCSKPENRLSFPPIVFHITDGEFNDCSESDLLNIARSIRETKTKDGNTLLINIHLSSHNELQSEIFPSEGSSSHLSPHYNLLYNMSSTLPEQLSMLVSSISKPSGCGPYRGMAYNASASELLTILNIGSESINLA